MIDAGLDQSEGQDREVMSQMRLAGRGHLNAVSNTLLSLTLNMTGWHVSHDRCLELLPYSEVPPARRGYRVSLGESFEETWQAHLTSYQQQNVRQIHLASLFPFGIPTALCVN